MIGLFVTLEGFPGKLLTCSFHKCTRSTWLAAFSLVLDLLFLLLTSFTVCLTIRDCLSSTEILHNLEKAIGALGHYVNADKTEYMFFNQNQTGDISTLKGGSLKLVDKFTYLGSSVSSTEKDINTRQAKA